MTSREKYQNIYEINHVLNYEIRTNLMNNEDRPIYNNEIINPNIIYICGFDLSQK